MSTIYLLDTNTVSYIANGRCPAARARLEGLASYEVACISSITEAEIRYGIARRPQASRLRAAVEVLLSKFRILAWGSSEAAAYGELRADLEARGTILSELDTLIAAHAIAQHAVLVSNDKAFSHVAALHGLQNWTPEIQQVK
ncbi:MAG TPA: PIN domain-containing protein [Terracidiphilus sp.]|nr:PIN domain-containing protein [Terracidiphilus sp.]